MRKIPFIKPNSKKVLKDDDVLEEDDNVREILSQNIKNARLSSNLTQENLAEKTEISLNFLKEALS